MTHMQDIAHRRDYIDHDPDEFTPSFVRRWGRSIKLGLCAVTLFLVNPPLSWIMIFWICAYRWQAPLNEAPEPPLKPFAMDRQFWLLVAFLFSVIYFLSRH